MNAAQSARLAQMLDELRSFREDAESIRNSEREAYDARSERWQESDAGQEHDQLIGGVDLVVDHLAEAISELEEINPKPGALGKGKALSDVLRDHYSTKRRTRASYRRVSKCLDALGLQPSDKEEALQILEYHDEKGQPFAFLQPRKAAA
jgi:hypothetical protein